MIHPRNAVAAALILSLVAGTAAADTTPPRRMLLQGRGPEACQAECTETNDQKVQACFAAAYRPLPGRLPSSDVGGGLYATRAESIIAARPPGPGGAIVPGQEDCRAKHDPELAACKAACQPPAASPGNAAPIPDAPAAESALDATAPVPDAAAPAAETTPPRRMLLQGPDACQAECTKQYDEKVQECIKTKLIKINPRLAGSTLAIATSLSTQRRPEILSASTTGGLYATGAGSITAAEYLQPKVDIPGEKECRAQLGLELATCKGACQAPAASPVNAAPTSDDTVAELAVEGTAPMPDASSPAADINPPRRMLLQGPAAIACLSECSRQYDEGFQACIASSIARGGQGPGGVDGDGLLGGGLYATRAGSLTGAITGPVRPQVQPRALGVPGKQECHTKYDAELATCKAACQLPAASLGNAAPIPDDTVADLAVDATAPMPDVTAPAADTAPPHRVLLQGPEACQAECSKQYDEKLQECFREAVIKMNPKLAGRLADPATQKELETTVAAIVSARAKGPVSGEPIPFRQCRILQDSDLDECKGGCQGPAASPDNTAVATGDRQAAPMPDNTAPMPDGTVASP